MTAADNWSALLKDFAPRQLPATLATGVVLSLVNALLGVALMTLIFSGELAEALPLGIGVGLAASAALALVTAVLSGFPGMYAGVQDNSAAILGLAGASIATSLVGPEAIDTVLAMMMATSLATGGLLILMGTFRLGEVARFVPFPVIGGLLAGTGYLILVGSLGILGLDAPVSELVSAQALGLLWPGLTFAAAFLVASLRHWPAKAYLVFLVVSIAGFHAVTALVGIGREASLSRGWLLGPFPKGGVWPGFAIEALIGADWGAIVGEAASLVTILLLAPVTLLLYISAVEVGTNRDLDLNSELRTAGWANLASGAMGGPPGYLYLSDTLISHRLLGGRRGPSVVAALGLFAVVLVGGAVLEYLPQFVIGGLLLFVGIDFLVEWLWTSRHRMTRLDYALMVGIVVIVATVGFLPGVAAGLAAAVALFVYRYSKVDVVKHHLTAREHQSNIERRVDEAEFLYQQGDAILALELQGFVFFGTANQIVGRVKSQINEVAGLQHIIFDFRLVSGVDSTAVALFERIGLLAREHGCKLVLTGLQPSMRSQFAEFLSAYTDIAELATDLDHGMQLCEDRVLERYAVAVGALQPLPDGLVERLGKHLVSRSISANERIMSQGDPNPGMFLITSGKATVFLEQPGGDPIRLRTVKEGTILGEIGLYRDEPCTATVVADTPCDVLHLTPQEFENLCRDDPVNAAELHAFVARILAGRVSHGDRAIRALHG